jgi:hypothetical protein
MTSASAESDKPQAPCLQASFGTSRPGPARPGVHALDHVGSGMGIGELALLFALGWCTPSPTG